MNNVDFSQLKQKILPYFIEIYGEEFKDILVSKMNQIEPIFYSTIDSKKSAMYTMQTAKRIELTIKFLEHNNVHLSEETKSKMIKRNSTYELLEIPEAKKILSACFGSHEYREVPLSGIKDIQQVPTDRDYVINQSVEALRNLGFSVNAENYSEWVLSEEAKQIFMQIEKLKEYINILDIEFRDFDKQFNNLKSLIDKSNEIDRNIREKQMIEFLKSISNYLTTHDKKVLDEYISSDKKDWYSFKTQMDILKIAGDSFYENGLLEAFGTKANEKLDDPKTSKFARKTIIENRIKYYKLIGVYNEQMSPDEFLLTAEAKVNAPKQEFMDDIISKKEHFAKLSNEEFLSITSSYKDNLEQINSLGLVTDVCFGIDDIKKGTICINPNTRIINGQPESVALLFFSPERCLPEYIDTMFIHEVNHAVELCLIEYANGKAKYKCGFEFLSDEEDEIREYVGFSEVVNQMIAMEITQAMHRDNVYLFDNPNTSKIEGGTSYEQQKNFIGVFWSKFKKEIMTARVDNNLVSLFNIVGEDNFNKLNTIINEYRALPYYAMMDDVINKRTTELTEKRINLINSAAITWDAMIENAKHNPDYETLTEKTM